MNDPQEPADLPFRTVVEPPREFAPDELFDATIDDGSDADDGGWSVDDIEAAYRKALEAAAAVPLDAETPAMESGDAGEQSESEPVTSLPQDPAPPAEAVSDSEPTPAPEADAASDSPTPPVTPQQIIEALLFVGGRPLTTRQICDVLGGNSPHERVDEAIERLNETYARQQRPYEIRLVEGGWQLELRQEFEKVRSRVFGVGPREVRLSQDVLEVLAFVAYQQPVAASDVEATGHKNVPGLLRQLLRRELIALNRDDAGAVTYTTTRRFLELFGLGSLRDLPRPEQLGVR